MLKRPLLSVAVVRIGDGVGPGVAYATHGSTRTATPEIGAPEGSSTNIPEAVVSAGVILGSGTGAENGDEPLPPPPQDARKAAPAKTDAKCICSFTKSSPSKQVPHLLKSGTSGKNLVRQP